METAEIYRRFASAEAHGRSACYERWANGVAADAHLLHLLEELPAEKRQPNLIFAAARFAGIEPGPFDGFRNELIDRWQQVVSVVTSKRTQTNEPGRCAVLLPVLAALPQPLALLEVGASAGLCLYPDRFSYQYGGRPRLDPDDGPGPLLTCAFDGPLPVPAALPEVVWRAGVDLNPLDVTDPDDVRWLKTLVWPEQQHRRDRLDAAIRIARADPPFLVAGDLNETVEGLAAKAPADATLVIFHSAVLAYLGSAARAEFVSTMRRTPGHWISNESPRVVPFAEGTLPASPDPEQALFVIARDAVPVAYSDGHGAQLHWFGS